MSDEWEYKVELGRDVRKRKLPDGGTDDHEGIAWAVIRSMPSFSQTIIASTEVFETDEEAKRDALIKLSQLRCPIDQPLDKAIKWLLE